MSRPLADSATITLPPAKRYGGLAAVGDRWIMACAVAAAIGAWFAWDWQWWWGALILAAALSVRLPALLALGALVLTAGVAHIQLNNLSQPESGLLDETVTLVSDPEWRRGALAVQVRSGSTGHRWEAWARGSLAYRLERGLAGERWQVAGKAEVADSNSGKYLWPRHLVGQVQLAEAQFIDGGGAPFRFANHVRRLISSSSKSLSQRDQALLAGFVYGDDRDQLPEVLHDFRATSLTHLLAVSGSNVAFVLLLVAPLLLRLRLWWRLVAVMVLLAEFALLTRAEPSVLRACVLATLAVGAQAVGRSSSVKRLLALAVIVLLVADPLLVRAAGFQLSVAAAGGIVLGAGAIERRLAGPRWLRLGLAVTLAAQLGVLPVQLWLFGSLPLVSVPANVLAVPMAGPAMIWGLIAGVVGGLGGEAVAAILHLPTQLMVGWVALVAEQAAALGWPAIEPSELVPLALIVGVAALALKWLATLSERPAQFRPAQSRQARWLVVIAATLGVWLVASWHEPAVQDSPHLQVHTWPDDRAGADSEFVVAVVDRPAPANALGRFDAAGHNQIDVLVARSPSRVGREAVRAILERVQVNELWTPVGFGSSLLDTSTSVRVITEPTSLLAPSGPVLSGPVPNGLGLVGPGLTVSPSGTGRLTVDVAS